jgi:hypothetical protein
VAFILSKLGVPIVRGILPGAAKRGLISQGKEE